MLRGKKVALKAEIPCFAREWRNDPAVWKWCRQWTLIDEESHERWVRGISEDASVKMFGVYEHQHGVAVGVTGLTSIDRQNQSAEFSLYIEPSVQARGFGADALQLLVRHGFLDWNLNRIWGEVYSGNPALQMFETVGFKREGLLREAYFRDGRFIDCYRIALLRSEYVG